jgi:steroid delta-isomerase-like uncharacterized protein
MSTEDNKALMRRFLEEVFNKRNLAAIDEFIAPDHVDHTLPAFLPTTPEGTKRAIGMYLKAFPDLHLTVEDMIAEGDKVVTRFTSHGTQKRAFMGIPPTGKQVTVSSIVIARIAGGKIVEQWGLDDQMGMLQQLGMIPALFGGVFLAGLAAGMGLLALLRKVLK